MSTQQITFNYYPGIYGDAFMGNNAELIGSWNEQGLHSDNWTQQPMQKVPSEDGGYKYEAIVGIDVSQINTEFKWGVRLISNGSVRWAIATEVNSEYSIEQCRSFIFNGNATTQKYYLTTARLLGANKYKKKDNTWGAKFRVWAPNAISVDVVFGALWDLNDPSKTPLEPDTSVPRERLAGGYIHDDGTGIHPHLPIISMIPMEEGVWETPDNHPDLQDISLINHRLYMYRLVRDDESTVFRSDLYSRCQSGFGKNDPSVNNYSGALSELSGRVSCSVTVDPEKVVNPFSVNVWPEPIDQYVDADIFWEHEFSNKQVPNRVEDLVIYELHLGALGFGSSGFGTLKDAIDFLDHIEQLNVNAIELLPVSEAAFDAESWGYATSHFFAIEYSGGGRDQFKHFIRECHRRGIAVIMDVVYNHYDQDADRAQRYYDSPLPEKDIYYWYEGSSENYRYLEQAWGTDWKRAGYIDNQSTGDAPALHQEMVRKLFISSAVSLIKEFHIDGFRVDQTTSIHQYNTVRENNREARNVNIFGAKFLREFGRTLRLFKPNVMLIAEDHSEWDQITTAVEFGGMGFDAKWYSEYYHNLIGDTKNGRTNLLRNASLASSGDALEMSTFSDILWHTKYNKVVYSESHDEAGNSQGHYLDPEWNGIDQDKKYTSHRTIVVAVNTAALFGETRKYAEARCRYAWGITALSAGTPMFLLGEEVGAEKRFKYIDVMKAREDLLGMRNGSGKNLYKFYSDINALRINNSGLRSRNIDIVHADNSNRVIVFRRWDENQSFLIFTSLSDYAYPSGYIIQNDRIEQGDWKEVFNSDSSIYGGNNVGNLDGTLSIHNGFFKAVIPFSGLIIFKKIG